MTATPNFASGAGMEAGGSAAPALSTGPFVLNLCSSTTPMALAQTDLPELRRFTFFVSRRFEEGRERFRLHMGYFATLAEAEEWLGVVREIYPGAWAGETPGRKLRERAAAAAAAQAQHAAGPQTQIPAAPAARTAHRPSGAAYRGGTTARDAPGAGACAGGARGTARHGTPACAAGRKAASRKAGAGISQGSAPFTSHFSRRLSAHRGDGTPGRACRATRDESARRGGACATHSSTARAHNSTKSSCGSEQSHIDSRSGRPAPPARRRRRTPTGQARREAGLRGLERARSAQGARRCQRHGRDPSDACAAAAARVRTRETLAQRYAGAEDARDAPLPGERARLWPRSTTVAFRCSSPMTLGRAGRSRRPSSPTPRCPSRCSCSGRSSGRAR